MNHSPSSFGEKFIKTKHKKKKMEMEYYNIHLLYFIDPLCISVCNEVELVENFMPKLTYVNLASPEIFQLTVKMKTNGSGQKKVEEIYVLHRLSLLRYRCINYRKNQ